MMMPMIPARISRRVRIAEGRAICGERKLCLGGFLMEILMLLLVIFRGVSRLIYRCLKMLGILDVSRRKGEKGGE